MTPIVVGVAGETLTIAEWAKRLGCEPSTIYRRIDYGWDAVRAVTTPVREHFRGAKPKCSIRGCPDQRHAKGHCHRHYHEQKRQERKARKESAPQ